MSSPFQYSPLDTTTKTIRLAVLFSGTRSDELLVKIKAYPLSQTPPYEALSYVWGSPNDLLPLTLTSFQDIENTRKTYLQITTNLHTALLDLRFENRHRTLWIDALCINQSDLPERASQVTLMTQIYMQAFKTLIYLGSSTQNSVKGMEFIQHIVGTIDPSLLPKRDISRPQTHSEIQDHVITKALTQFSAFPCMLDFLTRPWWSRIWIIQELTVSAAASLVWGTQTLPWEFAARTVAMFDSYVQYIRDSSVFKGEKRWEVIDDATLTSQPIYQLHQQYKRKPERPLLGLLDQFWMSDSTDPRDKVYALLGLATDDLDSGLKPDYIIDSRSLYGQVVHDIWKRTQSLDILSFCTSTGIRRVEGLPTWAPDWTSGGRKVKFQEGYYTTPFYKIVKAVPRFAKTAKSSDEDLFCASGSEGRISDVRFSTNFTELHLTGVIVDTISFLSPIRDHIFNMYRLSTSFGPVAHSLEPTYLTGEEITDAFRRTICLDRFPSAPAIDDHALLVDRKEYEAGVSLATSGRRFFITKKGFMGLSTIEAEVGDLVCLVKGVRTPAILRREGDHYLMVCESYGMFCSLFVYFRTKGD
jgi:hypothetical protein